VFDPVAGRVRTFRSTYTASLAEDHAPALCDRYLKGTLKHNVRWESSDIDGVSATAAFIGHGQTTRVGYFHFPERGGCGCSQSGVAVVEGHAIAKGKPNASLQRNQSEWWRCDGAGADLIQVGGTNYVDAWGGTVPGRSVVPRVLLQFANNKFQPICRIAQVVGVTSVPPQ
jgi:hypothetical protein